MQLNNDNITKLDSILIPSDELNFITNYKYKFKNIFSGIPFNYYNDHNFSPNVLTHIKKIIISNFKDNEFYRDYNYELYFEDYFNEFKKWINKYKIKNIGLPYVTKGNWNKIYIKLINDNSSVNFVYLHRKYDKEAWQFSKKGFFNFKKQIPELITRL